MTLARSTANRIGFIILGLTNNFAYVIMLSAAYDLLSPPADNTNTTNLHPQIIPTSNATTANEAPKEKYCNEHSTSAILLADTLPSLTTKILYPWLFVGIPTGYKASATAFLSAAAFIITGISADLLLVFTGVICASFSSGLGESTYLSNTPLYGHGSLSSWSMGTGAAGLLGTAAYAILKMALSIKVIMIVMLIVPVAMMIAYFLIIEPVEELNLEEVESQEPVDADGITTLSLTSRNPEDEQQPIGGKQRVKRYGSDGAQDMATGLRPNNNGSIQEAFDMHAKVRLLPSLAKYFLPLLLVYFAEYFINQGLFELVYYPEVTVLNHAAQYRWFQVSYQLGVFISRSSLDLFKIKGLWTMALLQTANAALVLAHASKLIHIPSFYLVIALIIYEGLLGGFTYVNTFYRVKSEVKPEHREFCISAVTMADSLGIVMAAFLALPVHETLCKLYE